MQLYPTPGPYYITVQYIRTAAALFIGFQKIIIKKTQTNKRPRQRDNNVTSTCEGTHLNVGEVSPVEGKQASLQGKAFTTR